ncbi:MAG: hydratase [Comamonadaceae bacterium]|nr:MAG: hydratase [Comamonadaceae bacterium]
MTPQSLLSHHDTGQPWPSSSDPAPRTDTAAAYRDALAVRALRAARGEQPRGYKIGFTNRGIWPVYQVFAPIWGTVWDSTLSFCEDEGVVSLARTCEPRLEPEVVFGLGSAPPAQCTLEQLFESIAWMAPGFEIVQSHRPGWKFTAADTIADGGLHARLLVGRKTPLHAHGADAAAFEARLASAQVALEQRVEAKPVVRDQGRGANVLDGPLHALLHFVQELRACDGAPGLQAGDVVTTGTWTDAWSVAPGEVWTARFGAPLSPLSVRFTAD